MTPPKPDPTAATDLIRAWTLPSAMTLGSTVRAKGILQEVQAHLPIALRQALKVAGSELTLRLPAGSEAEFARAIRTVETTLATAETQPVIPREIEDILAIKTSERHRWLKDGRLPSAGTRTVKLRGRARKITFHVFDPAVIADILDSDRVDQWREDDVLAAAENRRRAAWQRKLVKAKKAGKAPPPDDTSRPNLVGWQEFEGDIFT